MNEGVKVMGEGEEGSEEGISSEISSEFSSLSPISPIFFTFSGSSVFLSELALVSELVLVWTFFTVKPETKAFAIWSSSRMVAFL